MAGCMPTARNEWVGQWLCAVPVGAEGVDTGSRKENASKHKTRASVPI
jgi:hypothetical protein